MTPKYKLCDYPLSSILGFIKNKEMSIPEIQRPFVWKATEVRDLIDSLYKGYPAGYLIISQSPSVKLKDGKTALGKKIIIDGQQRITALMTAIEGLEVLSDKYSKTRIKIAFNPCSKEDETTFEVQTPVHENSNLWISDISILFKEEFSQSRFIREYRAKNKDISELEIEKAIERIKLIKSIKFGVVELDPNLSIDEITEIFVRINSKGIHLNQADFAMSKIAADTKFGGHHIRKSIDYFCHLLIDPSFFQDIKSDTEFSSTEHFKNIEWVVKSNNELYEPDYRDIIRVVTMLIFNRGKLSDLVSLLSGRDFKDRSYKEEIIEDTFKKLENGLSLFMNKYNFESFILTLQSAGFIHKKLLNSKMTLDFAYTLYLLLNNDSTIDKQHIKQYVQKWFVLSTLTSRYIGSPESQMDRDLRSVKEKGFPIFLEETEHSTLTKSFWETTLPSDLETSSANSPFFFVYIAAQVFNNDRSFLSKNIDVQYLVENLGQVHHIFPLQYLKENGFSQTQRNQIANFTYIDPTINNAIKKRSPKEYFSTSLQQCSNDVEKPMGTISDEKDFYENLQKNCIPEDVVNMSSDNYLEFLKKRRALIATKIQKYYYSL
ncbi:MAG: GmrSD restriction endonuclease domain-containing protein [Brevinema sp.]